MAKRIVHHSITHGMSGSREYASWVAMMNRCNNPNVPAFKEYGARGITVCERWRDFNKFYADMGPRPEGCSIDRIDNGAGYSPSNCRWASRVQQNRNQRTRADSTTGVKGVSAIGNRWKAHIGVNGKQITIGRFDTLAEAYQARKQAEDKYWD